MSNARMFETSYGFKYWKNAKGQYHRTDGPAIECMYGDKVWYQNDKLHRTDGPSLEYTNGYKEWYVEGVKYTEDQFNNLSFMSENEFGNKVWKNSQGQFHRTDGPAIEYVDGHKEWWVNGELHRTDGPAVEYADGGKSWYQNDKLHRTDGPAVEYEDGYKAWYVEGVNYTEEEFNNLSFMYENFMGDKLWKNPKGQYHRTDGPAFESADGKRYWFVNGVKYTKNDFINLTTNSLVGQTIVIGGVEYVLYLKL